jgi:4-coumarate--CoA ligase
MKKFDLNKYMRYLDTYRITFMTGVPAIIAMMCKQGPELSAKYNLKSIEQVTTGSAPLDSRLGKLFRETYLRPGVLVKQGWGMTETTCSATGFSPDDVDDGRSVGWLNPNCSAKIVNVQAEEYESVSNRKGTGELWVSGPNIMKGYWNRPEATAETIVHEDGRRWLRTGDIGYVDEQGNIYIVDRLKVRPIHSLLALDRANTDPSRNS